MPVGSAPVVVNDTAVPEMGTFCAVITAGDAIVIVANCDDVDAIFVEEMVKLLASGTVVTVYEPNSVKLPIKVLVATVNVDPTVSP